MKARERSAGAQNLGAVTYSANVVGEGGKGETISRRNIDRDVETARHRRSLTFHECICFIRIANASALRGGQPRGQEGGGDRRAGTTEWNESVCVR